MYEILRTEFVFVGSNSTVTRHLPGSKFSFLLPLDRKLNTYFSSHVVAHSTNISINLHMFGDPLPHRHPILLWFRMQNFKLLPFSITTGSVTIVPVTTHARAHKPGDESLMFVPCITRRCRNNQHYALNCTTPLFHILAPTRFGSIQP
jgi:hypothetical protein